uniref:ZP domain-containing protein n=1 Tax=Steinernema glaseri TaxID=37863 RepID=A0A1I8AF07_9BILA
MNFLAFVSLAATVVLGDEFSDLVKAEVPVKLEPLRVFADKEFWNVTATPDCTLSLHRTTCSSPPLGYYDTISWSTRICFKWRCNHDDYAMRVEKCWTGSRHNPVYLVGPDGCTAERSILRTPSYDSSLQTATSLGWLSVRLVGTRFVRFGCDLRLCNKCDPNCSLMTPPQMCPDYIPYHGNKAILNSWNSTVIADGICEEESDESDLLEDLSTEPPCDNGVWRGSYFFFPLLVFLLT